jgi:xanthine dehydrogenase accessory factor
LKKQNKKLAVIRGGGDLATGIIYRLWKVGFEVLCLETEKPTVVRRTVAVATAVFNGNVIIEDMQAILVPSANDLIKSAEGVSVLIDPEGEAIEILRPDVVIDAIMAKRATGTNRGMAPIVIAIGPGFKAPEDVDAVIETKRGHWLGRVIRKGAAIPNTGVPGMIRGYTTERLLRAPTDGYLEPIRQIGDEVEVGDVLAKVSGMPVVAQIEGVLRGLIHPSVPVHKGMKIGDVDPRGTVSHCYSITDKALSIAGGVLEVIMSTDPHCTEKTENKNETIANRV